VVSIAWSLKPVDGIVAPFSWRPTVEQWVISVYHSFAVQSITLNIYI
jgi:hypothetical protein